MNARDVLVLSFCASLGKQGRAKWASIHPSCGILLHATVVLHRPTASELIRVIRLRSQEWTLTLAGSMAGQTIELLSA